MLELQDKVGAWLNSDEDPLLVLYCWLIVSSFDRKRMRKLSLSLFLKKNKDTCLIHEGYTHIAVRFLMI